MTDNGLQFLTLRRDVFFKPIRLGFFGAAFIAAGFAAMFMVVSLPLILGLVAVLGFYFVKPLLNKPDDIIARLQVSEQIIVIEDPLRQKRDGQPTYLPVADITGVRQDANGLWLDTVQGHVEFIGIASRHADTAERAITALISTKDAAP